MVMDVPNDFEVSDKIFEWLMILLGILQAAMFQYVAWLAPVSQEPEKFFEMLPKVLDLLMKITLPFVFTIVFWVYSITRDDEKEAIRYRIYSWGIITMYFIFYLNALNRNVFILVLGSQSKFTFLFEGALLLETLLLPLSVPIMAIKKIREVTRENQYWESRSPWVPDFLIGLIGATLFFYLLEQIIKNAQYVIS